MKRRIIITSVLFGMALAGFASSNGGDQRVTGDYLVNLSRAPFTPIAGMKTAMTVSFVDLKTDKLISEDILVTLKIGKGRGSREYIYQKKDLLVEGGVLDYPYTFADPGIHEIFFDFTFVNDPLKTKHELPDFLIDVQPRQKAFPEKTLILAGIIIFILGFTSGYFLKNKKKSS